MEKIWAELKKIETNAEEIRTEAKSRSKQIVELAIKESAQLVAKSRVYAVEDSEQLFKVSLKEADQLYKEKLKMGDEQSKMLEQQAEKYLEKAVGRIVSAILGEADNVASKQIC